MHRTFSLLVAGLGLAAIAAGCAAEQHHKPRLVGQEVLGALTPAALRDTYRTPAFVVRGLDHHHRAGAQDTDLAADAPIDDRNLIIFAEGAGDTVEGFRQTARLVAESPHDFPGAGDSLVIIHLKWCESGSAVTEHMNHKAQEAGAVRLAEMLEVHRLRHGAAGRVGIIGFSAGTRVTQIAFSGAATHPLDWHAEAFALVDNVAFVGSSMGTEEEMPLRSIRGRFLNFVNPRDTHFGDRAAFVAPAGSAANPLKLLQQATLQRRPRFGASVAGFRALPMLTAVDQFDDLDAMARLAAAGGNADVGRGFKRVNVPVPPTLMAFNIFGAALPDDDYDDYLNLAPNHYILVGRGSAGRTDLLDFRQYREASEEFVREHLAAAALHGRLHKFDLHAVSRGADPLGLPTFVPWAVFSPGQKAPEEPAPKDDAPPTAPTSDMPPPPAPKP